MSRFATNKTTAVKPKRSKVNVGNRAGGSGYEQSDKMKLASILLTSFVKDNFYRGKDKASSELQDLIRKVDPEFAAKAAIYARNEFGMRSITHIVGGEIPAYVKGERWVKRFLDRVIHRPDDATEILAYYLAQHGKPVPNSLKKGISLGLTKFDAYQLAKYRGEGHAVKLVDAVNLVHAKPSEKNKAALEALIDGELRSTDTFEAKLTVAGKSENKEEAKSKAWADLIVEGKIGQFALLRNLRNIETQAPAVLSGALKLLVQPSRIKSSLILPFRYATAIGEVSKTETIRALNKALDISTQNVPKLSGRTLVAIDHSGSMGWADTNSPKAIADLFAAVIFKSNECDVAVFGSTAGYVEGLNPDDSTLTIKDQIARANFGHATNFSAVFELAEYEKYDRIITLSDMQSWADGRRGPVTARDSYEKVHGPVHFYNFDLAGYGTTMFPTDRVYELVGFSEKVFDIMGVLEQDKNALVNKIESVVL